MNKTDLVPYLKSIKGKKIIIKSSGYLACQTTIEEFDFYIMYDILTIKDVKTDNYLVLNLSTIKQIRANEDNMEVIVFVNDEIESEICIEIK